MSSFLDPRVASPLLELSWPSFRFEDAAVLKHNPLPKSFGLVLSLYMLVSNYLEQEQPPLDATSNICTEAALCLFFRYGPLHNQVILIILLIIINKMTKVGETHLGLAGQMLYSLIAVAVNLLLVGGALGRW